MTYKERVQAARQADIPELCQRLGIEIEPEKYGKENEYRIPGHGGLLVCNNGYYQHGNPDGRLDGQPEDAKNNAISFVMYFCNQTFSQALDTILGNGYNNYTRHDSAAGYKPEQKHAEITQIPEKSDNYRNVMAYLCQTRGLSAATVQECIDRGLLYQDARKNAVFVCRDEQGQVIGYEIKGTNSNVPFKGTRGNAVFRFACGTPTGVIAFESAIDLLSYYDINRQQLTHHLLLSMGGCRHEILEQVLSAHPDYAVGIATDNDEQGNRFHQTFRENHPNFKIFRVMPKFGKDWNDTIKDRTGKKKGV